MTEPDWEEIMEFFCPDCDQFRDGMVQGFGDESFWTCGTCRQIVASDVVRD